MRGRRGIDNCFCLSLSLFFFVLSRCSLHQQKFGKALTPPPPAVSGVSPLYGIRGCMVVWLHVVCGLIIIKSLTGCTTFCIMCDCYDVMWHQEL